MVHVLRRASENDVARLAHIGLASFLEAYHELIPAKQLVAFCRTHHTEPAWLKLIQSGGAAWIAEERDRNMVGYALLLGPGLPEQAPGEAELLRLYTLVRSFGHGLGKGLLEVVEDEARKRGATRMSLGVYEKNVRAIAFYTRHGFQPVGNRVFMVDDLACNDVVMAKPLTPT